MREVEDMTEDITEVENIAAEEVVVNAIIVLVNMIKVEIIGVVDISEAGEVFLVKEVSHMGQLEGEINLTNKSSASGWWRRTVWVMILTWIILRRKARQKKTHKEKQHKVWQAILRKPPQTYLHF
mmetsp:Transcript_11578/g.15114  ORF Transcript_11578/g.15114 Transcript_11578/m.15114 type:complete len:125 (+) Transcript_11578:109-483(+)